MFFDLFDLLLKLENLLFCGGEFFAKVLKLVLIYFFLFGGHFGWLRWRVWVCVYQFFIL